jgi:hypothetical protein
VWAELALNRPGSGGHARRIVVDANRTAIRPIQPTGLDQVLTLYHTIEEALIAH